MKRPILTVYYDGRKEVSKGPAGTIANALVAVMRNRGRFHFRRAEIFNAHGILKTTATFSPTAGTILGKMR